MLVPTELAVTNPELLILATKGLDEVQGFVEEGLPLPLSCVVETIQANNVPEIVGNGFTVMVLVFWHPLVLVYVITVEPALIPVTSPELLTVATPGLEELQGVVVAVALPVN